MNIGEMLRAKLMMTRFDDDMNPKVEESKAKLSSTPGKRGFNVTNNLNRVFFDYAKNNLSTRKALIEAMVSRGYKKESVATLITQMVRQGLFQPDDEGLMHLTVSEYTPIKGSRTLKNLEQARNKVSAKAARKKVVFVSKRTGLRVGEEERPVSSSVIAGPTVRSTWNAHSFVAGLNVVQAQELYAELKKIFGDNK